MPSKQNYPTSQVCGIRKSLDKPLLTAPIIIFCSSATRDKHPGAGFLGFREVPAYMRVWAAAQVGWPLCNPSPYGGTACWT